MQGVKWMRLEGPTPICFVVCLKRERCTSLTFQNSISYSSNIWGCKKSCFKCSSSSCLTSGVHQKLVVIELCRWVSTRVVCLSLCFITFLIFKFSRYFRWDKSVVCCPLLLLVCLKGKEAWQLCWSWCNKCQRQFCCFCCCTTCQRAGGEKGEVTKLYRRQKCQGLLLLLLLLLLLIFLIF